MKKGLKITVWILTLLAVLLLAGLVAIQSPVVQTAVGKRIVERIQKGTDATIRFKDISIRPTEAILLEGLVVLDNKPLIPGMDTILFVDNLSVKFSLRGLINGNGAYEIIPLQFGSGRYQFTLMIAQKKGSNRCSCAGTVMLNCRMANDDNCFLYPNQYVDYDADSPLVEKAQEICRGLTDPKEIAKAICGYVSNHFVYDWLKAGMVKSGQAKGLLPDIGTTWETKKGICQDLSAVLCAMLRSQGIPAKLAIGSADGSYHSWVVIIIDGKTKRFDPSFSARSYKAERYY